MKSICYVLLAPIAIPAIILVATGMGIMMYLYVGYELIQWEIKE